MRDYMARIGESIEGERIDLDAIRAHSGWKAFGDKVQLFSKDGKSIVATISIHTLLTCWIEKEEGDFEAAHRKIGEEKELSFNFVISECCREAKAAQENMIKQKDFRVAYSGLYHCWIILAHHFKAIYKDKTFREETTRKKGVKKR